MRYFQIFFLALLQSRLTIYASFEFNNVKCLVRDPKFMSFDYCYLKSVNRSFKYISLKSHFHILPIENAKVIIKVFKRDNSHLLDRHNVTVDACRFLKDRRNIIANILFSTFAAYSNVNHTCPYDHDIYVEKLPTQYVNSVVQFLIPDGRYYLNTTWSMSNIPRAEILVYFSKF